MSKWLRSSLAILVCLTSFHNQAAVIGSVPTEFGEPTFGGMGIPNDTVSHTIVEDGSSVEVLLGLSITQRFNSPTVTNDGVDTYFSETGESVGTPVTSPFGSKWNFNVFVSSILRNPDGSANDVALLLSGLTSLELLYDVDPQTGAEDYGSINLLATLFDAQGTPDLTTSIIEFSQNLAFGFLYTDIPGLLTAPGGTFNVNDIGQYNFRLSAAFGSGASGDVSINAQINAAAIPEPGTLALSLLPLAAMLTRRKRV